jgi:hypothetical protein
MINENQNQYSVIKKKEEQQSHSKTFKANRVTIRPNSSNDGYVWLKPNISTGREISVS